MITEKLKAVAEIKALSEDAEEVILCWLRFFL